MGYNEKNITFIDMEYSEIGKNLRHLNDIRSKTYHYSATMTGILLVGLTSFFHKAESSNIGSIILLSIISMFGVIISLSAYFIEKRSVNHFHILTNRAIQLEKVKGITGQITLSNKILKENGQVSVYITSLYFALVVFWCTFPISIYSAN